MKIQIIQTSHHRNGVCGNPFAVTLFRDEDGTTKVCVDFGEIGQCPVAVLDVKLLAAGDVAFGSNSFRGDYYSDAVRKATAGIEPAFNRKKIRAEMARIIGSMKKSGKKAAVVC